MSSAGTCALLQRNIKRFKRWSARMPNLAAIIIDSATHALTALLRSTRLMSRTSPCVLLVVMAHARCAILTSLIVEPSESHPQALPIRQTASQSAQGS
ncbi:hypothetical protein MRB53_036999 [Persea americana]|nr:hypothetical protein MRB53_036999 [Persea americana]